MVEIRIRRRNQFTLPAAVVKASGLVRGDRVLLEIDPADPDTIVLRRIRERDHAATTPSSGEPPGA